MMRFFPIFLLLFSGFALADDFDDDYEKKEWVEIEAQLPPAPKDADYVEIVVSATATNKAFVDTRSVSVGADAVVRYTLAIVSPSGARNVSYEGVRCETRERRVYAFGKPDGGWSKSRNNQWARIENYPAFRYHAALYYEYFCPQGAIVHNAPEAVDALRRGGHPMMKGSGG